MNDRMMSGRKQADFKQYIRKKLDQLQPIFHSTLSENAGQFFEFTLLLGAQQVTVEGIKGAKDEL